MIVCFKVICKIRLPSFTGIMILLFDNKLNYRYKFIPATFFTLLFF